MALEPPAHPWSMVLCNHNNVVMCAHTAFFRGHRSLKRARRALRDRSKYSEPRRGPVAERVGSTVL